MCVCVRRKHLFRSMITDLVIFVRPFYSTFKENRGYLVCKKAWHHATQSRQHGNG